jgi:hypothetical protein
MKSNYFLLDLFYKENKKMDKHPLSINAVSSIKNVVSTENVY